MEVEAYLARHHENRDERGRALVACEGHGGERKVTIGSGRVPIRAPRVNDKGVIDGEMNAPTREECQKLAASFVQKFGAKYPKATKSLETDFEGMTTRYDFPAEHGKQNTRGARTRSSRRRSAAGAASMRTSGSRSCAPA